MRECGVLLPVSSLPSKYGIGGFSKEAYEFVDKLHEAGQSWWQILPLGPTGYGDSPYQSFSSFAINPYFIDPDGLKEEGLLTERECKAAAKGWDARRVDYGKLYQERFELLRKAYKRFQKKAQPDWQFMIRPTTQEYCFYMALKNHFGGKSWRLWEDEIQSRNPMVMMEYERLLEDDICFYKFLQIKAEEQWEKLKLYANMKGIKIIGDIPIYVAMDSADAWAYPELFQFDDFLIPQGVAGCPPDAFSATGQLWGNPLYNWKYHKKTMYAWWLDRVSYCMGLYDLVRIDHFRGFDSYYSIPFGDPTAKYGHWEKGPGMDLFRALEEHFHGELPIIAEDLGMLTPSVHELLEKTGFPGMKVLEFAFTAGEQSSYLPSYYPENCVVYTGTHDNDTVNGWYRQLNIEDREFAREYAGIECETDENVHWAFIRLALMSKAKLAIIPMQDYLGLGSEARINQPATLGNNWTWRMLPDEFDGELARKCRRMAQIYGRFPVDSEENDKISS